MQDRFLSLLGLCRRAGKLTIGNDPVLDSISKKKAELVIIAGDCSKNTSKGVLIHAHKHNVQTVITPYSKDDISFALGKYCAVLSIEDKGFAKKAYTLIVDNTKKED